jgi:hypothetical protein
MTVRRQRPVFPGDIHQFGGVVSVASARDRIEGAGFFRVRHTSAGGDLDWVSPPIPDVDRATAAAECLGAFLGAQVVRG